MRRLLGICALTVVLLLAGCSAPTHSPAFPDRAHDGPGMSETPAPDPDEDVVGWENGIWYDDPIPVDASDGLNESELALVVNRSMARVEYLRRVEFNRTVPVEITSREEFAEQVGSNGGETNRSRRLFRNARLEALFLVGESENAIERRRDNTRSTVRGYYAPGDDRITIISETDTPALGERTLGHELVHAYQWGRYDMGRLFGPTTEDRNTGRAVFEGEARYVDRRYADNCGTAWECATPPPGDGDGGGGDFHRGLFMLQYFPYSDGPGLIDHRRSKGGWGAVTDLYAGPPESTEQVVDPRKYRIDPPTNVTLRDGSDGEWRRVRPPGNGPNHESFGQPGITAMLAYPALDDRDSLPVVPPARFLNYVNGSVDGTDPYNYDIPPAEGWDGDRMYVYENGSEETGYVWRLAWDSAADAREFATAYRRLLGYWGGKRTGGVWRIPGSESDFADAFAIRVSGSRVTIVNGPTAEDLGEIHAPAGERRSD
jgi:hypothetical protein